MTTSGRLNATAARIALDAGVRRAVDEAIAQLQKLEASELKTVRAFLKVPSTALPNALTLAASHLEQMESAFVWRILREMAETDEPLFDVANGLQLRIRLHANAPGWEDGIIIGE